MGLRAADDKSMRPDRAPGRRQLARRLIPFGLVAALGLVLVPLPGQSFDAAEFAIAAGLTLLVAAAVILAPWQRLPSAYRVVPALAYLLAVLVLRDAAGGATGGVGPLVLLPVVWVALYGNRRELVVVIAGVAAVNAVPLLVIGAPAYPSSGWRAGVLFVVLAAIVGGNVQRLIHRVREQATAARRADVERAQLLEQLELLASTDPLTGVGNRRAWDRSLQEALTIALGTGTSVCIVFLDLDGLKVLNDTAGHEAGDRALSASAQAWRTELRPDDVIARLGGDEFAVVLTDCDARGGEQVVERLRKATAAGVRCSAGLVQWDRSESADELQQRADALLYRAKREGGDRTLIGHLRPAA